MQPSRKIASNRLLRCDGTIIEQPLIELDTAGCVVHITTCREPDREPFTHFRAGLVVMGLSRSAFVQVVNDHHTPLTQLLPPHLDGAHQQPALLTGLDYAQLTFTSESCYELL